MTKETRKCILEGDFVPIAKWGMRVEGDGTYYRFSSTPTCPECGKSYYKSEEAELYIHPKE